MNQSNELVNIKKKATIYDVEATYHSDRKCQNYDLQIQGVEEPNGTVTLKPANTFFPDDGFKFYGSDPDRIIAIAEMMRVFALKVKEKHKIVDISTEER